MPADATNIAVSMSVVVLDSDTARGDCVAARLRGELGCQVRITSPLDESMAASERRMVRVSVLTDLGFWREDPSRLRALLARLNGAPSVVLVSPSEPDLAVAAVAMGACEVVLGHLEDTPVLGAAVRVAAARWTRARAENRRRAAIAGALTRTRNKNRRLDSLVGFLRSAALTDPLTGLANRRALEERLDDAVRSASRDRAELAVLAIDIDNLKAVNDSLGHDAGDELLKHVACVLKTSLRGADVAARVGGDEFVVLLPGTGENQAQVLAARIQRAFVAMAQTVGARLRDAGSSSSPGLSIGIASRGGSEQVGGTGRGGPDLVVLADLALCDAKRKGKGRVEVTIGRGSPAAPIRGAA